MDARNAQASAWLYRVPGHELHLWGAALTGAGRERVRPGQPYPLDGHTGGHAFTWERGRILPFLQLIVCLAGGGRFESGPSRGQDVRAGDALLLLPGVRHRYRPDPASGWRVYWLELAGPVVDRLQRESAIRADRPLLRGAGADLRSVVERLVADALRPGADAAVLATSGLAVLARALGRLAAPEDPLDEAIARARERLAAGSAGVIDLRRLARDSGLSYAAFRRRFVAAVGMPPRQCEILARLGRARALLAAGSGVAEAASACGFASPFYFSRRFSAAFGVPPSACRG